MKFVAANGIYLVNTVNGGGRDGVDIWCHLRCGHEH